MVALLAWALPLDVHRDYSRVVGDPPIPKRSPAEDTGSGSQRVAPEHLSSSNGANVSGDDPDVRPPNVSRERARELEDYLL